MRTRIRRRLTNSDEGTTLVEMLVVTIIFTLILAIITSAIITMDKQSQRENGLANNLDASRKVLTMLDHSVRYANAITLPGTGTDGSYYVEWQTGNAGQQQTCTQWRYVPTGGKVQFRSWLVPLTTPATVTATGWATAALNITQVGATPIWSIPSGTKSSTSSTADTKEQLAVQFTSTSGQPPSSSTSQITLTAINSSSASPPTTATCTQVGRP
jgi:Tfp pilus assembly protein PilW